METSALSACARAARACDHAGAAGPIGQAGMEVTASAIARRFPVGAEVIGEADVSFRLWAPAAQAVSVVLRPDRGTESTSHERNITMTTTTTDVSEAARDLTHAAEGMTKAISPAQHAVLDYGVAAAYFTYGVSMRARHRGASTLAFVNGAMVLAMSMLTNYPGGVFRKISFRGHRTGDIVQAALAGLGPILFRFGTDREANYFYGQALSEVGVIAATDWDAA
jgi:hypothetical protein